MFLTHKNHFLQNTYSRYIFCLIDNEKMSLLKICFSTLIKASENIFCVSYILEYSDKYSLTLSKKKLSLKSVGLIFNVL